MGKVKNPTQSNVCFLKEKKKKFKVVKKRIAILYVAIRVFGIGYNAGEFVIRHPVETVQVVVICFISLLPCPRYTRI